MRVLFGVAALAASGCDTAQTLPPRAAPQFDPSLELSERLDPPPPLPALEREDEPTLPPQTQSVGGEDRLQPGVVLSLQVTSEPALSVDRARVARDGSVFVPFLGRVDAQDLTPPELSIRVETALVEKGYLRDPQVHVEVLERSGRRAYVLGRVGSPGAYDLPFHQDLTLTQLIAMAGGLATTRNDLEADASAIRLIRTVDGRRQSYRLSFLEIVNQSQLTRDVLIQDQDVIYVPPKLELFIFGSVQNPGGYALADRSRVGVDEAIGLAGGFNDAADREGVLLIRRGPDGARTYRIPEDPSERAQIEVTANDTVIVPGRTVRRVYVLGSVSRQGGIPLDESDLTVIKALSLAGGLERIAASNSVRLIRRAADGTKKVYEVPVGSIIASGDLDRDPVLQPGDIIWVPEGFF